MILGDFNLNYFDESSMKPLKSLMDALNNTQMIQSPTFVSSGSLLDHIYPKSPLFNIFHNSVVSVYYSDHDAVKLSFTFN